MHYNYNRWDQLYSVRVYDANDTTCYNGCMGVRDEDTVASAALSYVFSAGTEWLIIAFIPGIGPFAMLGGALVSIGVSIFIDWTVEEYGWLDSIKDWVESW